MNGLLKVVTVPRRKLIFSSMHGHALLPPTNEGISSSFAISRTAAKQGWEASIELIPFIHNQDKYLYPHNALRGDLTSTFRRIHMGWLF